jgi:hypothetical protein
VVLEGVELDVKGSIGSGDGIRIVPFKILCDTVPDVYTLPERVISVVECSSVIVKLVRKLERVNIFL